MKRLCGATFGLLLGLLPSCGLRQSNDLGAAAAGSIGTHGSENILERVALLHQGMSFAEVSNLI
jgi:hypothetical protein